MTPTAVIRVTTAVLFTTEQCPQVGGEQKQVSYSFGTRHIPEKV